MATRNRLQTPSTSTKRARRKRAGGRAVSVAGQRRRPPAKKWSASVMQRSNAMDLEKGVFTKRSARQVALSLKRSAQKSRRRKSAPFRSAMSMLNFAINRGGKGLSPQRRRLLNKAKAELRKAFHRP
ncbi:MAG: DUF3175 domain-containing protein [Steroidobacteraceae bacterium]